MYAPYLKLISVIVVIASLVQVGEMVIKKLSPTLFRQLGIVLPLITMNCAILGLAIFQSNRGYGFFEGLAFALGVGAELTLAEGTAPVLLIAGSLSLAFMGFAGLLSSA